MTPKAEGERAFMDKLPVNACPYEEGTYAYAQWKLGYYQQEYEELKNEQANILETMGFHSPVFTGLEDIIRNTRHKISKYRCST
jgi:hypothetical protein